MESGGHCLNFGHRCEVVFGGTHGVHFDNCCVFETRQVVQNAELVLHSEVGHLHVNL